MRRRRRILPRRKTRIVRVKRSDYELSMLIIGSFLAIVGGIAGSMIFFIVGLVMVGYVLISKKGRKR